MSDLRLVGYISMAFIFMMIVQAWNQDYSPKPLPAEASIEQNIQSTLPDLNTTAIVKQQAELTPAFSDAENTSTELVSIENEHLRLSIDTKGGTVVKAELLNYPRTLKDNTPFELLSDTRLRYFVAQSGLQAAESTAPSHYDQYQVQQKKDKTLTLQWQDGSGVQVLKTFTLQSGSYTLLVNHDVNNASSGVWRGRQYRQFQRVYNENDHKNGFTQTYMGGVIYNEEDKYKKIDLKELAKGELNKHFAGGWAAMIQHYFGAAWIPIPSEINQYYSKGIDDPDGYRYLLGLSAPIRTIAAGQSETFSSKLFIGPKIQQDLSAAAKGLELTVDYGIFTPISQPLFWALNKINDYVHNWGWAIVLLTLLIKLIFFYPSQISYKSMAKMREAQPKMLAVRERYADDKQRQGQAMMELYKKEKINPASGCLPMLIQIPVFISLYWALLESVELRQAPWALWIKDLSAQDPFYILPIIMGISMYIQQKLNPQPTDPIQAKVFAYLPFIFTVFFAFFPSGLVLYWITNNILTIAQQWYINTHIVKK